MMRRLVKRSLSVRKARLAIAVTALLLASSLITALLTISLDVGRQAGKELEAYGPNIVLVPGGRMIPFGAGGEGTGGAGFGSFIPESTLSALASGQAGELRSYIPLLYGVAKSSGEAVVVVGTDLERLREMSPHWRLTGVWPGADTGGAILGVALAEKFGIRPGDRLELASASSAVETEVTGVAEVGGSEDGQVFLDLRLAQELTGRPGQVDLVQIRASTDKAPLSETTRSIENAAPGVSARILGQVADAEKRVLSRVQLLVGMLAVFILLAAVLTVFSTVSTSVLERTREIGLMKALGAGERRIAMAFLAEAWVVGAAGGLAGFVLGTGLAQAIGLGVFGQAVSLSAAALPLSLGAAMVVTTLASLWPVRRAVSVEPVTALRGE